MRRPRILLADDHVLMRRRCSSLLKDFAASELTTAIREALLGRTYVSPLIAGGILEHASGSQGNDSRELSPREREVLRLLAEGKSMKEAAASSTSAH